MFTNWPKLHDFGVEFYFYFFNYCQKKKISHVSQDAQKKQLWFFDLKLLGPCGMTRTVSPPVQQFQHDKGTRKQRRGG